MDQNRHFCAFILEHVQLSLGLSNMVLCCTLQPFVAGLDIAWEGILIMVLMESSRVFCLKILFMPISEIH